MTGGGVYYRGNGTRDACFHGGGAWRLVCSNGERRAFKTKAALLRFAGIFKVEPLVREYAE